MLYGRNYSGITMTLPSEGIVLVVLALIVIVIAIAVLPTPALVERAAACEAKQGVEVRAADGSYICIFKGALLDVRT